MEALRDFFSIFWILAGFESIDFPPEDLLVLAESDLPKGLFLSILISNLLGVAIRVFVNLDFLAAKGFNPPFRIFENDFGY